MLLLALSGMYRAPSALVDALRGRELLRATLLMAAVVLAILFWLRLPDVSRTYLLILFPAQFLVTLATRAVAPPRLPRHRSQGLNKRFVLVAGSGRSGARVRHQAREPS